MRDVDKDIFGKIDSMRERLEADILSDKGNSGDVFPMLTEVIKDALLVGSTGNDGQALDPVSNDLHSADRRVNQRRQFDQIDLNAHSLRGDGVNLPSAFEQKLSELFDLQQLRMEDSMRKLFREELAAHEDGKSVRTDKCQ